MRALIVKTITILPKITMSSHQKIIGRPTSFHYSLNKAQKASLLIKLEVGYRLTKRCGLISN